MKTKRNRKPRTARQKAARNRNEKSRWRTWKQNQRSSTLRNSTTQVRHHASGKATILSRRNHAQIHKRTNTQGGRPRKKGRK